ncbi:MAG: hypothetical protein AAGG00_10740 [Cyanobacteria bacterium P01_H01_bin.150]
MNTINRYWNIWRIDPAAESVGYKQVPLTIAQEFVNNQLPDIKENALQNTLLSAFNGEMPDLDIISRASAGLCLRCYISEAILKECKKIDYSYSGQKQFSYRELLPFVLNDDGEKLIILDRDSEMQLMVDDNNQITNSEYNYFSLRVLETYNADLQSRMSLDNWACLQTRQNHELRQYLSEFGLRQLSDWAILNKATAEQLERLSTSQRYIVEAYHAVYRRDRQQTRNIRSRRCPDPNFAQLKEMLVYLLSRQVSVSTTELLVEELRQIALQFRRYDIWGSREYLEIYNAQSDTLIARRDLFTDSFDETDIEQQELIHFLRENLSSTLATAVFQEIQAKIQELQNSPRYEPFAQRYLQGLELYYCQIMSLREIFPILEMSSWNQARRILNPGELLSQVRARTIELMLESILSLAAERGLTTIPPTANYFKNLIQQVESYIDGEIFKEATEELRTGKNRTMDSVYAEAIRCYIQKFA